MPRIEWSDSLKVNLDFIDEDHQHAVELINALAEASTGDRGRIPELAKEFAQHCREHFAREEEAMRKYGFPAFPIHKGEHDRVLGEVQAFLDGLDGADPAEVDGYLTQVVPDWFLRHLATMDTATAGFINQMSRGV